MMAPPNLGRDYSDRFNKIYPTIAKDTGVPLAELDTLETGPLKPTAYEEGLRRNLSTVQKHLGK